MLLQLQDALLLILLPLVGGLSGYLLALRWSGVAGKREAAPPQPTTAKPDATVRPALASAAPKPAARLPAIAAPPALPALPALPHAADLLLVDDSAVARAMLRKLFEPAGYQVHLACDGIEALALLKKGHYALMVTDLEMPNMDGVALINACLDSPQTARMPILAISGHESLRAKFNECRDVAGVHRKPWVDDILLSHVATLVSTRRARVAEPA